MSTPEFFTLDYGELLIEPIDPGVGTLAPDKIAVPNPNPDLCYYIRLSSTSSAGDATAALSAIGVGQVIDLQQPSGGASGLFVVIVAGPNEAGGFTELRVGTAGAGPFPLVAGDPVSLTFENAAYIPPTPTLPPGGHYATVEELARLLHMQPRTAAQEDAMERVLAAAATEIDNHLGRDEPLAEPYPDAVVTVNLQMAEELWRQETNPHGVVVVGGDTAIYPGPDKLAALVDDAAPVQGRKLWCRMSSLLEIVEAMAEALESLKASIPDLQVYPFLNVNPTPPSVDMYPANPFQSGSGFGGGDADTFWTVRARTTTADHESGQKALLRMLDRRAPESVASALELDQTLGGRVQSLAVPDEAVSGYQVYLDDPQGNGSLIGCEWRVEVLT